MARTELEHCLRLVISNDKTEAILHVEPDTDPSILDPGALCVFLDTRDIGTSRIIEGAIEALIEETLEEPSIGHSRLVASGVPANHGKDGCFAFTREVDAQLERVRERRAFQRDMAVNDEQSEMPDLDDDDKGVDHYNNSAFVIVRAGDVLGQIAEPTEGEDGVDLYGNVIPAKPGKRADITFDELSIDTDAQGRATAKTHGQLVYTGINLAVCRELIIEESVDFRTGNIDFPGDVTIKKGVRDCFVVRAAGDIRIGDLVEAATLDAKGNIELAGGMAAREKGLIRTRGDLNARYLDNVNAEIGGCLTIDREINTCTITVAQRIESPALVIRGGDINCLQRVDVAQIGGEGEVKTFLVLGKLDSHDKLIQRVADTIPILNKSTSDALNELKQHQDALAKPTTRQTQRLNELQSAVMERTNKRDNLTGLFDRLTRGVSNIVRTSLTVRRSIFPGTTIWVAGYRIEFTAEMKGPLILDLDEDARPRVRDLHSESIKSLSGFAKVSADERVMPLERLRASVLNAA